MARCLLAQVVLLLLGLLLLPAVVTAKVERGEDWMYNAFFAVSDKPLLKRAIEQDRDGKAALSLLLKYYEDMDKKLQATIPDDGYQDLLDSNIDNFLTLYGWPKMNETQIIFEPVPSRFPGDQARARKDKKEFAASEKPIYKAMIDLGKAIDGRVATNRIKSFMASRKGQVFQWQHVFHNNRVNYTTERNTHKCKVRSNLAYRVKGKWYVGVSVTNDRPTAHLRDGERIYLGEYFRIAESGELQFLPYMFDLNYKGDLKYWGNRPFNKGSNETHIPTPASTSVSEFGGTSGIYYFLSRDVKDNIAVQAALEDSDNLTHQVLDSKVWSNTAILLFPLFLSLVPLALFADVSDRVLLGYMIFTDFLSVLPLAIKGGELILAGRREYFSTRTLLRGVPKLLDSTLVASTWSCRCEAAGNITGLGVAFVVIAIAAVIIGVSLEFLVKAKVEENNRLMEHKFAALNSEAEYSWERSAPCVECECHARSAVEPPSGSLPSLGGGLIGQIQQRRKEESQRSLQVTLGAGF